MCAHLCVVNTHELVVCCSNSVRCPALVCLFVVGRSGEQYQGQGTMFVREGETATLILPSLPPDGLVVVPLLMGSWNNISVKSRLNRLT